MMTLDENSRLSDILAACPWLPEELGRTDPRAKPFLAMLRTPLGAQKLKTATVADAAAFLHRPASLLVERLSQMMGEHENDREED